MTRNLRFDLDMHVRHERTIESAAVGMLRLEFPIDKRAPLFFFETLFSPQARLASSAQLALVLNVNPSTFQSRFFRAKLPSPKRYLAFARLVRAAKLLEDQRLSLADVANRLDYSSSQHFGRHVRLMLGITGLTFRERYNGALMLYRFRDELITPHWTTLSTFNPQTAPVFEPQRDIRWR